MPSRHWSLHSVSYNRRPSVLSFGYLDAQDSIILFRVLTDGTFNLQISPLPFISDADVQNDDLWIVEERPSGLLLSFLELWYPAPDFEDNLLKQR